MNHPFKDIYNNRSYGIYVHGVNRFVLIDSDDIWVTMKTAQAISSKAVTSVCVLPQNSNITNDNCLNYTIEHEDEVTSMFVTQQLPQLRIYNQNESTAEVGPAPEGAFEAQLLKEITTYVHCIEYVLTFNEAISFFNKEAVDRLLSIDQDLINKKDNASSSDGIINDIRRIAYYAESIHDIKWQVVSMFARLSKYDKIRFKKFILKFYEMLGENLPVNLEHMRTVWE